jgi:hypothetical protein
VPDAVLQEQAEGGSSHHAPAAPASAAPAQKTPPAQGARAARVRGITGSLTAFEVEQAMNTRKAELLACVEKRPRSLAHVAGDIAFHVDLDGQGKVERVAIMQSDIGYAPLEDCLAAVVATAPFPVPAGAERAETQWRMSVDPLRRPATPIDSASLEDTIKRQSDATYERCNVGKGRRFAVSGYLGGRRKLYPLSVRSPWRGPARPGSDDSTEQLSCVAEALQSWKQWPKARGYAKVSFELRWAPAPPPQPRVTSAQRRVRRRDGPAKKRTGLIK